ncbi:MAG TPA: hypothetical protein VK009_02895 [Chloroflexota bacterium]|nr:hypothetical protein [Chloroflexota bacterium]
MASKEQPRRVGGMTGNKVDNVKQIERDSEGDITAEPGDVHYVRDEVAPAEEEAREEGKV